jgi:hypothetical protein
MDIQESPASFSTCLRIVWAVNWRYLVIGLPVLLLFALIPGGLLVLMLGTTVGTTIVYGLVTLAALLFQAFCLQLVMGSRFGKVRLVVVADDAPPSPSQDI